MNCESGDERDFIMPILQASVSPKLLEWDFTAMAMAVGLKYAALDLA